VIIFVNIYNVSYVDDVTVTCLTKYVAWLLRVGIWADYHNAGVVAGCQRTLKQNIGTFSCTGYYRTFTRNHDMKVNSCNLHGEDCGPFHCCVHSGSRMLRAYANT
jgi:hypothetical protein